MDQIVQALGGDTPAPETHDLPPAPMSSDGTPIINWREFGPLLDDMAAITNKIAVYCGRLEAYIETDQKPLVFDRRMLANGYSDLIRFTDRISDLMERLGMHADSIAGDREFRDHLGAVLKNYGYQVEEDPESGYISVIISRDGEE